MNLRNLCYQAALNYHKFRCACKPSEHCYFKGKYKAYCEMVLNECGFMHIEHISENAYKVTTHGGFYWFEFLQ